MKLEQLSRDDVPERAYDVMYFSPVEIGKERYQNMLYYQTDIYHRKFPEAKAAHVRDLHAEMQEIVDLGVGELDQAFLRRHHNQVLEHNKISLAYLDAREPRIALHLLIAVEPATTSKKCSFDFLRIVTLSNMAACYRRLKMPEKAHLALTEATQICHRTEDHSQLLSAMTFLNFSSVCVDLSCMEDALAPALQSLQLLYALPEHEGIPSPAKAYYIAIACHNAAVIFTQLRRNSEAVELTETAVDICCTHLKDQDDGLFERLVAIGARAKNIPEIFWREAVAAQRGLPHFSDSKQADKYLDDGILDYPEPFTTWNVSFWDFKRAEVAEIAKVLDKTTSLKRIIFDTPFRKGERLEDFTVLNCIRAVCACKSLQVVSICGIDFHPTRVHERVRKAGFLEKSWYGGTTLQFGMLKDNLNEKVPKIANYHGLFDDMKIFMGRRLLMLLITVGNVCERGIDLSKNKLNDVKMMSALVSGLRYRDKPKFSKQVQALLMTDCELDAEAMRCLACVWKPDPTEGRPDWIPKSQLEREAETRYTETPTILPLPNWTPMTAVAFLDISNNPIGDEGFLELMKGVGHYPAFRHLNVDNIGLTAQGCDVVSMLSTTKLEYLSIGHNDLGETGTIQVCHAALDFRQLRTLKLVKAGAGPSCAELLGTLTGRSESVLYNLNLRHNQLGNEGVVIATEDWQNSQCLGELDLAFNGISSVEGVSAVCEVLKFSLTLKKMDLTGNNIIHSGMLDLGHAVAHSACEHVIFDGMDWTPEALDEFVDGGAGDSHHLNHLSLSQNPLGDVGLNIIATALAVKLRNLTLGNVGLTSAAKETLLNLVTHGRNLQVLDLSNKELDEDGLCGPPNDLSGGALADMVWWLAQTLDTNVLRWIDLSGTNLGDQGLEDLKGILGKGSMQVVGLRKNSITDKGLCHLMDSNVIIHLEKLDLEDNMISEDGAQAFLEKLHREQRRSMWNPKQITSKLGTLVLRGNDIPEAVRLATNAYLKSYLPLLSVQW